MKLNRLFVAFSAIAVMLPASTASAASITVTNHSFETLGTLLGGCGTGCEIYSEPPGWSGSGFGAFRPGTHAGNTSFFSTLSDGITSLYNNVPGSPATQTVGATVQLGTVYTLMVDLGARHDAPFAALAALVINGTTYFATGAPPSAGGWSTYCVQYVGQAADVGSAITIQLSTTGVQGNFDNVRLDGTPAAAAVPEPASLVLLATGLVAVASRLRRRPTNR